MPDQQAPSPASPQVVTWQLWNKRSRPIQQRTLEQVELPIEGEARLVGVAREIGALLTAKGYDWPKIQQAIDDVAAGDLAAGLAVLNEVIDSAPPIIADLLTILLGVYPTNIDGSRNEDYDADRAWLLGAVNVSTIVEMIRVFIMQNDYARLYRTFSGTLTGTMDALGAGTGTSAASSEPLPDGQIVSADGSVIELDPDQPTSGTTEPQPSETETPSASS